MKITYYIHDLSFPLVEGTRKQAWWMAQAMSKQGYQVEIISTSKRKSTIIKEGIKIKYGSPLGISHCQTDIIHYFSHPSPLILPLLLRVKAKKQIMTFFDGNLNGFWKRSWDFVTGKIAKSKISIITVQTQWQKNLLKKTKLKNKHVIIIPPLIQKLKRNFSRTTEPTLLFMSHLSPFKGIEEVLKAFILVRKKIRNIKLIIADSKINKRNKYSNLIKRMNHQDIIVKGKVNPEKELSSAWIYLYPIRQAQETFSVPLSFIESIQLGTNFIGTRVGGIPEYFEGNNLISPKKPLELAVKIEDFIKKPIKPKLKKKIDNLETIKMFKSLYDN